jgi:lipoic acid synthetase/lipoate-protein ligase A
MLADLGIKATTTENNDVLIDGRKVSGNAFYHIPGHSIVHGTMLFDTDMQHMLCAITPPQTKLDKHGVQSVRQRITLLKDYIPLTLEELRAFIRTTLCDGERMLTPAEMEKIEQLEQTYLREEFIQLLQS